MKHHKLLLAFISFTLMSNVQALTLGQIDLQSEFRQPLNATIPILHINDLDLSELKAEFAKKYVFQSYQLERKKILNDISIKLEQVNGTYVLHLTSSKPVNDLYLDFILE